MVGTPRPRLLVVRVLRSEQQNSDELTSCAAPALTGNWDTDTIWSGSSSSIVSPAARRPRRPSLKGDRRAYREEDPGHRGTTMTWARFNDLLKVYPLPKPTVRVSNTQAYRLFAPVLQGGVANARFEQQIRAHAPGQGVRAGAAFGG